MRNLASQAFSIPELPNLTGLSTDGSGKVSFDVPVTQRVFAVVFTSDGTAFTCKVGHLDPIDTLTGVIQRLQNLGFLNPMARNLGISDIDTIRAALHAFKEFIRATKATRLRRWTVAANRSPAPTRVHGVTTRT